MPDDRQHATAKSTDFLPAAGFHFLTPLYELLAWPMLGGVWRDIVNDVIQRADSGATIVDLGCGPATVLRRLAAQRGDLSLVGVDIDETILAVARRRVPLAKFVQGSIDALPIESSSADIVTSSMVFHHLRPDLKQPVLREAQRILKPAGLLLLCDFSVPVNKRGEWLVRWFGWVENGVARQGAGELLEVAARQSLTIVPRWTRVGCITQYEVRAAR